MARVRITYCVPCRYRAKAIQDGNALLEEFGRSLDALELVPGDHGVYDVSVDGALVYSLNEEYRFPETSVMIERVRARISETTGGASG